jgi:hypothetical protein
MNNYDEELQPPTVNPNPLNISTFPQSNSFTLQVMISNPNEQKLLWYGDKGETSWLTLEPSAGNLEGGGQQEVNVTVDAGSLEVGVYKATITFAWIGDDYSVSTQVPVTLTISTISPLAVGLSFALSPKSSSTLPLAITNRFEQTVGWFADTGGTSWLTLDRRKGILKPREQQTIYVTANSSPLASGDYATTLTFTSSVEGIKLEEVEGTKPENVRLPVELHVHATPFGDNGPKVPTVSPNNFDFKAHRKFSSQLQITNQEGRGKVQWTMHNGGVNWLTLNPSSGTFQNVGDNVTVNVNVITNTLAPRTSTILRLTLAFVDPPLAPLEPTSHLIQVTIIPA